MKRNITIFLIFSLIFQFLMPIPSRAAEFNPNFIISDEEMQNWQSMDVSDISAFLKNSGGYLSTFSTEDWLGVRKTASEIIYNSAKDNRINPKYLLVKLQKEQSLISSSNPTQKQLDWATGYGVCDGCSMDDPAIQKYKGFGTQVEKAAGIMRWYYDNYLSEAWIKRANVAYTIDGMPVIPHNLATAFLYTYTPHMEGNQNFWKLWNKWFQQIYPNGTLAKTADSATVYLIQDGKKRPFANQTALITRFDPKNIVTMPAIELQRYETGKTISLPNYSVLRAGSRYFLLNDDALRPFASSDLIQKFGYHPDEIIEISEADVLGYSVGEIITADDLYPTGRIVKMASGNIYYLKNKTFHYLSSEGVAKANFPNLKIEKGSSTDLEGLEEGEPLIIRDGTLVGAKGNSKIYVVEKGKKRHIANEKVFLGLGYKWSNIIWTDEMTLAPYLTGEPVYSEIAVPTTQNQIVSEDVSDVPPAITATTTKAIMVTTPSDKISFVGPKFTTMIDSYLVQDFQTGEVLAGKNIDTIRPMASLTKVATAYRLMKEGLNISSIGTAAYSPARHNAVYHNFRTVSGEIFFNKDLMSAMLVSSINTAGNILVDQVEKNRAAFILRLNEQAETWGLSSTEFADVTGENPKNVSTAREYATIFKNSINNADVRDFLSSSGYEYDEVKDLDGKPHHYDSHSNALVAKTGLSFKILASKTGYLEEAGACLAMLVQRKSDNKQFLILTMGNPDYQNRFVDPEKLSSWAMVNF